MGAAIDEAFRERLAVTVIAARKNPEPAEARLAPRAAHDGAAPSLRQALTGPPASRFGGPPPGAVPGNGGSALENPYGQRVRPARMFQAQLPLESASKGRFEKGEPNIHGGEDLDLPTYVRRGIALN
jgi:cell division protein FtsZ